MAATRSRGGDRRGSSRGQSVLRERLRAGCLDRDNLLVTVHVELTGLARTLVGRHLEIEWLPFRTHWITERAQSNESAARRHQAVADKATGWREHRRLRVAIAVYLAEIE